MTHSTKRPFSWAGIAGAVMLVFAGCNASYNPSFRPLDIQNDGIRYGFEEKGEGTFEWKITFPSSVSIDPAASSLRLTPEGGADVLNLDEHWLDGRTGENVLAEGTSEPLQAGVYFLRLLLVKDTAYILVVEPIAIHRDQTTTFTRTYSDDVFKPFVLLQVNVQVTSGAPVKPEEATLEFFSVKSSTTEEFSAPIPQTNGKDDVRRINMKELNREYLSEGWTALPQGSTDFWIKLTIRDAKGRNFIRTKQHSIGANGSTIAPITVDWGTGLSEPINLLNALAAEKVPNGIFTFASMGSDGKLHSKEEGYEGAEPGYEVRIIDKPTNTKYMLKWVQVLSNPWLQADKGKLVHNGEFGYFMFTMPKEIKPFDKINDIYDESSNSMTHDSTIQGKNAVIVTGLFIEIADVVALANDPNDTTNLSYSNMALAPSLVYFNVYQYLEQAIDYTPSSSSPAEQKTIRIMVDLDAISEHPNANNVPPSKFIRSGKDTITISSNKSIALLPEPRSNGTITIKRTDESLEALFTLESGSSLTIGINKDTGATFTIDGGGKPKNLIMAKPGSTLEIQGGTFTGVTGSAPLSAAIVVYNGTFNMTGGTIKDNEHALYIALSSVTLSGGAFIPYNASSNNLVNDMVMLNLQKIAVIGELTRLSKKEPALLADFDDKDWGDDHVVLTGDTAKNYEKFKVKHGKDNYGTEMPYTITSEGKLYGPQAYIDHAVSHRTYYLRLDDAVKAASSNTIYLRKDIQLGKDGNQALTVTGDSYITVPAGKDISLSSTGPTGQEVFTIKRANNTAKTLFTVKGKLDLGNTILDGNEISNSPPMVIVDGGSAVFTLSDSHSVIKNHHGTGQNAALSVKNGGTVELLSGLIEKNITTGYGGALYNHNGKITISGSVNLTNNKAAGGGGAIYNNGTVTISDTVSLTANEAIDGGALYNQSGTVSLFGSVNLAHNKATGSGGAIYNNGTIIMSDRAELNSNAANIYGNGIYQNGTFRISGDAHLTGSDVFLPKDKTIEIGLYLSGTYDVATITPEGPITAARKVLSGSVVDIARLKGRFKVNTPSGQPPGGTNWQISDTGYLF